MRLDARNGLAMTCLVLWVGGFSVSAHAQTRQEMVFSDREHVVEDGFWIYNDLSAGMAAAASQDRPMLVTLRCIPCEECVKLDEEIIESDPWLRLLLDQFVRVRLVSTNGLDLSMFQFDYDQSFTMLMMNADGTVYGRYGTRSDRTEWEDDVAVEGLGMALEAALRFHEGYPANREQIVGKQGASPMFATPNDAPSMRDKFPRELTFDENVVKNCIHCHMIGDAQRELLRSRHEPIPDEILFQYPHPKSLGLIMDPESLATVEAVVEESPADAAGLMAGDVIQSFEGQTIFSIADLQWVLHHAEPEDQLSIAVERGGEAVNLSLELSEGWRRLDDIEWRSSSWLLRRMATGGLVLQAADEETRERLNLEDHQMALKVTHVGQYGKHAEGKRAGFENGDVLVAFGGQDDLMRETDLMVYAVQNFDPGDRVSVEIVRNGQRRELRLLMQE